MKLLFVMVVFRLIGRSRAQWCMGGELIKSGLSQELQLKILHRHNELRDQVAEGTIATQPMAQNMKEMIWDQELANKAQAWANKCLYQHDPDRRNRKGQLLGQNLAHSDKTWTTDRGEWHVLSRMIAQWFDEVYTDDHQPHFSQIVWANTHKIGCGYSEFKNGDRVNAIFVCNYFPSGNVVGHQPYEHGSKSCEKHGLFASRMFRNLCAAEDDNGLDSSTTHHSFQSDYSQVTPMYQPLVGAKSLLDPWQPWSNPNPSTLSYFQQPQNTALLTMPSRYGFGSPYLTRTPSSSVTNIQGIQTIPGLDFFSTKPVSNTVVPYQYQLDGQYEPVTFQPAQLSQPWESKTYQYRPSTFQYGQFQPSYQIHYQPGSFQPGQNLDGWPYQTTPNIGFLQKLQNLPYRYEFTAPNMAAHQYDVGVTYPIASPVFSQMGFTGAQFNRPTTEQGSTLLTTSRPTELSSDIAMWSPLRNDANPKPKSQNYRIFSPPRITKRKH